MDLHRQLLKLVLVLVLVLVLGSLFGQTGTINVDQNHTGHKIYGLPTPAAANEAATKDYVDTHGGGGGGGVWGSITGTLSAQTDLQTALDNKQPIDADLTAIAALSGTHNIYYRSASNTWSSVTIGSGLDFTGATLSATGSGGNVSTTGSPLDNQVAVFTDATHVEGNSNLSFDSSTNILSSVIMSPTTGFRINGAAANRRILVGNATNFVQSTETYAVPGASGNVMLSDGTNWTSAQQNFSGLAGNWTLAQGPSTTASKLLGRTDASAGIPQEITLGTNLAMSGTTLNATGGGSVSITATSPIVVTPTPLTGTGVVSLNAAVDLTLTAAQSITLTDTGTANIPTILTLTHNSSGAAANFFGTALDFKGKSSTTNSQIMGEMATYWSTAADASRASVIQFKAATSSGLSATYVQIFPNGGLSAGYSTTTSPGSGVISAGNAYTINGTVDTSGKLLQSDGSLGFRASSATWPTTAGAGKIVQDNGTNFITSTPTWPTAALTAGYTVRSDGTNFTSYPQDMLNSSVTNQSPSTSDVYLAGSNVVVAAGDFKAKGQYHCMFDMTKSAGTGAIVITLRIGTAGSTSDPAIQTFTFLAGTGVADTGTFEVWATFRTVGSGTSAVVQSVCQGRHGLAATGLFSTASFNATIIGSPSPSSGFATNAATTIGLSFNGSTAFAGTNTIVQAQLIQ